MTSSVPGHRVRNKVMLKGKCFRCTSVCLPAHLTVKNLQQKGTREMKGEGERGGYLVELRYYMFHSEFQEEVSNVSI